ncbi:TPA: hypothetical protein ACGO0F_002153 [Streptococcus suis]
MSNWKTMSEVSKDLGISKDLVKYHKKNLPEEYWKMSEGKVYISEVGVEKIKGKLRKEKYEASFEESIIQRLRMLEFYTDFNTRELREVSSELSEIRSELSKLRKLIESY